MQDTGQNSGQKGEQNSAQNSEQDSEQVKKFNYKLTLAYDGTNYSGWQAQTNALSIQEVVLTAIHRIVHEKVTLIGSGRTDAGVHAIAQIAHFKCTHYLDLRRFFLSI